MSIYKKYLTFDDDPVLSEEDFFKKRLTNQIDVLDSGVFHKNKDGDLDRDDGPAAVYRTGRKEWFKDGCIHRDDGPASSDYLDNPVWCVDGKCYPYEEWKNLVENKKQ
jgi:hypothetical protein